MSFLKSYIAENDTVPGIRGIEMNAPYVPINGLADIGIEIEMEGRRLPTGGMLEGVRSEKSFARWTVKADNSLRNGGMEYVVSTPIYKEEIDPMIDGLWAVMKTNKTGLQPSNRCSTHVHVNVGGKKLNHLTSAIALWTTFEESLINWCGEERTNNHFCLSSKDSNRLLENWAMVLDRGRADWSEGMKYSALNMRTMNELGSIEFRTMRLDEDPAPIKDWVRFINGMCQFAFTRYENPELIAADMSERGGRGLFQDVCGSSEVSPAFAESVLSHPMNAAFDQSAMDGFRRAQSLILGYPWHEWLPLIQKEYVPSPFGKKKPEKSRDPGLNAGLALHDEWRAFEDRVRRPRRGEPGGRPENIFRRPINANLPVFFGDGTPGMIMETQEDAAHGGRIRVQPIRDTRWPEAVRGTSRWYNLADGSYRNGLEGTSWITNTAIVGDEAEPAPAPAARPAPQPAPPPRGPINPGLRVDPNLPIEFGDGTPALLLRGPQGEGNHQAIHVRAAAGERSPFWNNRVNATASYYTENGRWAGAEVENPVYPWIRNVDVEADDEGEF